MLSFKSLVVIPAWQTRRIDQLHCINGCPLTNESELSHDGAWHHWRWGHRAEARLQAGPESACPAMLPCPPLAVANSLPWGLVIYPIQAWSTTGPMSKFFCLISFRNSMLYLYKYEFFFFKLLHEQNKKQFKFQRESGSIWHESKMQWKLDLISVDPCSG